jgi:hypothetical protein
VKTLQTNRLFPCPEFWIPAVASTAFGATVLAASSLETDSYEEELSTGHPGRCWETNVDFWFTSLVLLARCFCMRYVGDLWFRVRLQRQRQTAKQNWTSSGWNRSQRPAFPPAQIKARQCWRMTWLCHKCQRRTLAWGPTTRLWCWKPKARSCM